MVALVIVSHSRRISDGLKRMADNMCPENVPVVSAGGMDDPEDPLGTDAMRILDAIQSVMSPDGVVVFWDLGAAKLNAETAVDFLEDEDRERVHLCDAPLVEGVLAATLQSAAGSTAERVIEEAQAAYTPPAPAEATQHEPAGSGHSDRAVVASYTIPNPMGLHARPAARFVNEMNKYSSDVRLRNATTGRGYANAKSINRVVTLEIRRGQEMELSADGPDAEQVHEAVRRLLADGFGEMVGAGADAGADADAQSRGEGQAEAARAPDAAARARGQSETGPQAPSTHQEREAPRVVEGVSIAAGFAEGPAHFVTSELTEPERAAVADPEGEIARFDRTLDSAREELAEIAAQTRDRTDDWEAQIFEAQQLHLNDPEIAERVREVITAENVNAEWAWYRIVSEMVSSYRSLEDEIMRARGDDLADVGTRVLTLLRAEQETMRPDEPYVLVTERLRPSDIPILDLDRVLGICTVSGSRTSHAGILASSLPVPVVFDLGGGLTCIEDGTHVLLDAVSGSLNTAPTEDETASFRAERSRWEKRREQAEQVKHVPAETRDGVRVRVAANAFDVGRLSAIADSGAEEVGLFRTEFLYMNRPQAPSLDEQEALYRRAVETLDGRPLVLRTMDIGGDKPVPYLKQEPETNPNLGWRGIRYGVAHTDILRVQIEAALRASAHGPIRVMFPMVSTVEEVDTALEIVASVQDDLSATQVSYDPNLELGIMVEVPAASEIADKLAARVDFFSIGTNDLTQYVMAADRGNHHVQHLVDPFHPAVIRAVARTIRAGHDAGIWVGMCGEMAGDPLATPLLLGLGLDEFSMDPSRVPEFKLDIGRLEAEHCRTVAQRALTFETGTEVRAYLHEQL